MSLREIGEAVGGLRPAVSDAIRRTASRLGEDLGLDKRCERLTRILKV